MKKEIRIIFAGTSDFALNPLNKLLLNNDPLYDFKIMLIITQPDKPKGRNQKIEFNNIKKIAIEHNIDFIQPDDINNDEIIKKLRLANADIFVTIAYGAFIGKEIRNMFPLGAINLHPSLLPKYRGADPVRQTILSGDEFCGNSIFFINSKIDSGRIILQNKYPINNDKLNNYTSILEYLSIKGADDLVEAIKQIINKEVRYSDLKLLFPEQDEKLASFSNKIEFEDLVANFNLPYEQFIRKINAYSYEPGYYCYYKSKRLKLYQTELHQVTDNQIYPIVKDIIKNRGFVLSLKDADLLILQVQYEGKNKMSAWDFINGSRLKIGDTFETETQ